MNIKTLAVASILSICCIAGEAANHVEKLRQPQNSQWHDNKYSMFIHFGLYSKLGGVWNGNAVKRGYSEQIQSHGGIQGDLYSEIAYSFDPQQFNADSIAALAKRAGMRSIVITSKHHDGFCMFRTRTTDYNSFDMTPSHRDFMAELSDACHRSGIGFGLYFSLIDWHQPCSAHITSHNTDFIPADHHKLNMAQVEELVTGYGDISELWFDMGSLTPEQSRELYDLVRKHQPGCMISGRLGNGCYDFAVMGDNYYPEASLQTAWQSAASMFDETWGYRSWQERGKPEKKADEKLRSLIRVVSGGGNFLLNIGPDDNGAVVPFEKDVLEMIGSWLGKNGDVIYGTQASPFRSPFSWGAITRKGKSLNLILSGERPEGDIIVLPMEGYRLMSANGPASASVEDDGIRIALTKDAYDDGIKVIRLVFDRDIVPDETISPDTRTADCSYFCQDYYTNARSEVGYSWNLSSAGSKVEVSYLGTDVGKQVDFTIDGKKSYMKLPKGSTSRLMKAEVTESERFMTHIRKGSFDSPLRYDFKPEPQTDGSRNAVWKEDATGHGSIEAHPFQTVYAMETVTSPIDQEIVMEVGAGNGIELYVNGRSIMKHLNPYRCTFRTEKVRVPLKAGENRIVLRSYNRFEKTIEWLLKVSEDQDIHTTTVGTGKRRNSSGPCTFAVTQASSASPHQDCELHNLAVKAL